MNNKDIGKLLIELSPDRQSVFNISLVCKSYNRAFNELKNQTIAKYNINIKKEELHKLHNVHRKKLEDKKTKREHKAQSVLLKFLEKAEKSKKHTNTDYLKIGDVTLSNTIKDYYTQKGFSCENLRYRNNIYKLNKDDIRYIIYLEFDKIIYEWFIGFIKVNEFEEYILDLLTTTLRRRKNKTSLNVGYVKWHKVYKNIVPQEVNEMWEISVSRKYVTLKQVVKFKLK